MALAALAARPPAIRQRAPLLLGALALLCAGRAAIAQREPVAPPGQPAVGHVHELRGSGSGRGASEAWTVGGQPGLMILPRGAVAPGDLVAVDPGARRAGRARSTHRPLSPRTSSLRPRADEIVRIPSPRASAARPETDGAPTATSSRARLAVLRGRGIRACLAHPDETCGALLAALVFGERRGLSPELTDLFTRTGTRHLLALSGFHVGLLAVLLVIPLARLLAGASRHGAALRGSTLRPGPALLSAAMIVAFIPLSGGGAPATRAAIGLGLALLSQRLGRRPSALNLIGVAALAEVAMDPLAPTRPGTQLSYLATAALVLAAGPLARALAGDPQDGGSTPRWMDPVGPTGWPRPPILVALVGRVRGLCFGALAAGTVASLATLPVVWSVFGEWSPVSLLATPVATPPLALLVTAGWLRLLLPLEALDRVASWSADGLITWLQWMDRLPGTPLPLPERPLWLILLASLSVGLATYRPRHHLSGRIARLGAAAFGVLLLPWPGPALGPGAPGPIPKTLELHVLDVGNGTAVVARAPGAPTWVLDAGSRDRLAVAEEGVGALLRALDTGAIRVGVSHDHEDHAGAIPWIVGRWDAAELHAPVAPDEGGALGAGSGALDPVHPRGVIWLDSALAGDPDPPLRVAAISSGMPDPNEGSAIFDLRWSPRGERPVRVVLCGDAEGPGLRAVLDGGGEDPWLEPGPVDVLLMPHHGSRTRHLSRLLERTQPTLAVVSGDVPAYADELQRRGIRLHVTGRDGPLLWRPPPPARAGSPPFPGNSASERHRTHPRAYTGAAAAPIHAVRDSHGGALPMIKSLALPLCRALRPALRPTLRPALRPAISLALAATSAAVASAAVASAAVTSAAAFSTAAPLETPAESPIEGLPLARTPDDETPDDGTQDGKTQDDRTERAVKRVLKLRGGSFLRGPSRRSSTGDWSVKVAGGWRTVPANAVLEAVEERVALARLEALCEEEARTPAEQVDGALELGLLPEACELCDELLDRHPIDLELRAAAARAGRYLGGLPARGVEDELPRLLDLGASPSRLMREAVVERLVTAADRERLAQTLRAELRDRRPSRRAFAAFATGRLFPREDPRLLLIHAVYDPSPQARESAARAISDVGAYEVAGPLIRALDSTNGALRLRAVEALGASRDGAFVEPLMGRLYTLSARAGSGSGYRPPRSHLFVGTQRAYVQDFDVEVAQGASVADPVVNTLVEGVVLDVSVIGVQEVEVRTELRSIRGALGQITSRRPGSSNKTWRSWWESEAAKRYRRPEAIKTDAPPSSHGEASSRRETAPAPR